jgi:hypothetical protein
MSDVTKPKQRFGSPMHVHVLEMHFFCCYCEAILKLNQMASSERQVGESSMS